MVKILCVAVQLCLAAHAAAAGTSDGIFDIDLATLSHPPLWEPTLEEYFRRQPAHEGAPDALPSPVVLTSPSREEFVRHARRGYPIVVADWAKGMEYDGWTGADFAKAFPFGYMKAEYIDSMPGFKRKDHDIKIIDDEYRFNLGSFKPDRRTMWYNFTRPASKRYRGDPSKPQQGPYVWHVKDELTPEQKRLVQERFQAPAFLQDPLNREMMNNSFEVWFSPGGKCGAGAHADGYCESVVSVQLYGDKWWRKMMLPGLSFLDSFDEFDGGVYEAGRWDPDLGFLNKRMGAVIWPPGYLHETSTEPSPDGRCGASLTLQYAFPQPVQYLRAFLPRLSLSSEIGRCVAQSWSGYATFYVRRIKPSGKQAAIAEQRDKILSEVDKDSDGIITIDEALTWFHSEASLVREELRRYQADSESLFLQFKAEDTVAYHDMDGDMQVSTQELWDSLVQWNVVRVRLKEGLKLVNTADRSGLEAFERSLDRFRRAPIQLPRKLRPELEALFSLEKGTKVLRSLKGVTSLSDSEFYSQANDIVEGLLATQGRARRAPTGEL